MGRTLYVTSGCQWSDLIGNKRLPSIGLYIEPEVSNGQTPYVTLGYQLLDPISNMRLATVGPCL